MPRVSAAHTAARRAHVLDAVRASVDRHGLQGTTIETIIQASGLSTGTVYKYIRSKEEGIAAAVGETLEEVTRRFLPVLRSDPLPPPPELLRRLLLTVEAYAEGHRRHYSLLRVAVHGGSALNGADPAGTTSPTYREFRDLLASAAHAWRADGTLPPGADPGAVSHTLLSLLLGFITQHALLADTTAEAHARACAALFPSRNDHPRALPRP
ncbi:TetR/AcrR family transcriptional regulator [Streptomyces sp. NPDC091281]|uniref:TetR/AcrR family transcriptional regulator n=1 Tax=Streptomyces sp. NPDC091281 TaxID=3365985 RepID=UPI0037F37118